MVKKAIYYPPVFLQSHCDRVCVSFVSYVHPEISGIFYRKLLEYSFELETLLMIEYGL